ncbi:MAG: hypothetical protein CH104c_0321 [Candidatus Woesebacteria bacterium]|nr:MAG: hypothetical protein CH104c_0321 [Candidatus Woesebacteria bacterium]
MEKYKLHKEVKILLFLLSFFLVLVFVSPIFMSLGLRYIPYSFQPPLFGSEKLFNEQSLSQEFISPQDNLTAIGVSIRNFNLQSKGDVILEVYSRGGLIRRSVVSGSSIKDGDIVIFTFDKIPNSRSVSYVFKLSTLEVGKEKAYEVYTTNEPQDFAGSLYINDMPVEKPISFLLYFAPKSRLSLVIDIYNSWFSRFYQDSSFFYFFVATLFLLTSLIIYFLRRER